MSRVYFPGKGRSLPNLCKSCANVFRVCYRQLVVSRVNRELSGTQSFDLVTFVLDTINVELQNLSVANNHQKEIASPLRR